MPRVNFKEKYIDDPELGRIYLPQEGMSDEKVKELQEDLKLKIKEAKGKLTKEDEKKIADNKLDRVINSVDEVL